MTTQHYQVITKIMVGAAITLGFCVVGAAPASADPNPFGGLRCSCRETAPAGSPALMAEIDRGIQEGHSAWLPGLAPPAQPRQPVQ